MNKAILIIPIIALSVISISISISIRIAYPQTQIQTQTQNQTFTLLFCNWQHTNGTNHYIIWGMVANVGNTTGSENGTDVKITITGPNGIPILTDYANGRPHSLRHYEVATFVLPFIGKLGRTYIF